MTDAHDHDEDKVEDHEPDPRLSFANERTFLAWHRTALALIGAGLVVTQVLPPVDLPGGAHLLGLPLIALGGVIAFTSYARWQANERAMRSGTPLPSHWLHQVLGVVVGLAAVVAAILAVIGAK
jgi:putative membrane protein